MRIDPGREDQTSQMPAGLPRTHAGPRPPCRAGSASDGYSRTMPPGGACRGAPREIHLRPACVGGLPDRMAQHGCGSFDLDSIACLRSCARAVAAMAKDSTTNIALRWAWWNRRSGRPMVDNMTPERSVGRLALARWSGRADSARSVVYADPPRRPPPPRVGSDVASVTGCSRTS